MPARRVGSPVEVLSLPRLKAWVDLSELVWGNLRRHKGEISSQGNSRPDSAPWLLTRRGKKKKKIWRVSWSSSQA
jgi:hypothetical protein